MNLHALRTALKTGFVVEIADWRRDLLEIRERAMTTGSLPQALLEVMFEAAFDIANQATAEFAVSPVMVDPGTMRVFLARQAVWESTIPKMELLKTVVGWLECVGFLAAESPLKSGQATEWEVWWP